MRISGVVWLEQIVDKLEHKHNVVPHEVEEVLSNKPKIRYAARGERLNEDVYIAMGRTESGRYMVVLFVYKESEEALILSVRDMAEKERKLYERK